ncbi:exodeoxyribonuclease III [Candidatus Symbiobacter mobilis]|uniref:Exonuclease III n=1 Tax=Candidatus Symbiobacter mobilis CR TaxID=946483 RepID=U5N6J8_9BURK|nr:exodeoxyribonuclease III [Candidatus Symbiobacter mobilis]AGX87002.1 exonuclease III [Candidatus Symbiobacter mobilis CR]
MLFATWNVNSLRVRLPQVLDWLRANPVDVLALQETKLPDASTSTLADAIAAAGYASSFFGQPHYNGVALFSRLPMRDVVHNIPSFDDDNARVISATIGPCTAPLINLNDSGCGVRVVCAYFPNGQEPASSQFAYKLAWMKALRQWLQDELLAHPALVLMGDCNVTFDDDDVWDPQSAQIGCTAPERDALHDLVSLGLRDAFRRFAQPPHSYSWWDYRGGSFRRNQGMRIDHILVSDALAPTVRRCWIDTAPRRNERPSDHAPVVVELEPGALHCISSATAPIPASCG